MVSEANLWVGLEFLFGTGGAERCRTYRCSIDLVFPSQRFALLTNGYRIVAASRLKKSRSLLAILSSPIRGKTRSPPHIVTRKIVAPRFRGFRL